MRAVVCTRYGPPEVLELCDLPNPRLKDHDLLVRICATAVNSSDIFVRSGLPSSPLAVRVLLRLVVGFGRPRSRVLGFVLAGEIAGIGRRVARYRVGDRVVAFTSFRFGCYAEFTCVPSSGTVALAPTNVPLAEAAALPYGGLIALHCLDRAALRAGQRVLIYGASGAVGTAAVQLSKALGAEVTGVCSSSNGPLVRSLGADTVLDYIREDAPPSDAAYDVVFDAVGKRKTSRLREAAARALAPGGRVISVDDSRPKMTVKNLERLVELVQVGKVRPVVDRSYALEQIVEAHAYVEHGHKRGNVVIALVRERSDRTA